MIQTRSYPRAAVIGNPSDGYFGKTIAFVFSNFSAEVTLRPADVLQIIPNKRDELIFKNLEDLHEQIEDFGYYGGIRLIKASLKKFVEYCRLHNNTIPKLSFSISYQSNIPNRLGLAGSSAIITAVLKAVFQFYKIEISKPLFANLVLSVELEELNIAAGLQDRVAQAYEEPVFMDFDKKIMEAQSYGNYEPIDASRFPNFYIAYRTEMGEGSEVVHNNLRERFNQGDSKVVNAMQGFAQLTQDAFGNLKNNQPERLGDLMDQNFDLRHSICAIAAQNLEMVNLVRSVGASAKFTGSGGAIIGTYKDEEMYKNITMLLQKNNIQILKPKIVQSYEG